MPTISYRATPAVVQSTGTTITFNKQAGTSPGDLIFLWIGDLAFGVLNNPISGFTQVTPLNGGAALYYRTADGTEGSTFSTTTSGNTTWGIIATIHNALIDVLGSINSTGPSTSVTANSITLSSLATWVLWFADDNKSTSPNNGLALTPPSGFTSQATNGAQSTANYSTVMLADKESGWSSGATGNKSGTASGSAASHALMVGLKPVPGVDVFGVVAASTSTAIAGSITASVSGHTSGAITTAVPGAAHSNRIVTTGVTARSTARAVPGSAATSVIVVSGVTATATATAIPGTVGAFTGHVVPGKTAQVTSQAVAGNVNVHGGSHLSGITLGPIVSRSLESGLDQWTANGGEILPSTSEIYTGPFSLRFSPNRPVANYSEAFQDNDRMKIALTGSLITVFKNNKQVLSVTDAFNSGATKHGMIVESATAGTGGVTVTGVTATSTARAVPGTVTQT